MSSNPYRDLPDHQFWRRSIGAIESFRFDPVTTTKFAVDCNHRVATAGSCFAQHISNRLSRVGFNYFVTEAGEHLAPERRAELQYGVFSARYGNIYTTRQLLQLFQECFDGRVPAERVWKNECGRYVDALRPQVMPGGYQTEVKVLEERASHMSAVRQIFEECDVFVFTLGLTEAWRSRLDGTIYPLAPGVAGGECDATLHEFVNLGLTEVVGDLEEFLERLRAVNPTVKVLLTVSPVPLIATYEPQNVLVATTYSKSVLRVAADVVHRKYDWVDYFPSFEIITGHYNRSAYYEDDYRGVNALGVAHVMRCFMAHYAGEGSVGKPTAGVALPYIESDVVCDEETIDQVRG